jgi:hypothetical protein
VSNKRGEAGGGKAKYKKRENIAFNIPEAK